MSGGSEAQATGRALLVDNGLLAAATHSLSFSNFVKRVRFEDMIEPGFAWLQWLHLYGLGRTRTYERRTTGIRNFKLDAFLASEKFLLPPIGEQRVIAHVLRTVQRAREATEQVIDAARQLRRSLLRHLFTLGPRSVTVDGGGTTHELEGGQSPKGWVTRRLEEVVDIRTSTSAPPQVDQLGEDEATTVLYLKVSDLSDLRNQRQIVCAAIELRVSSHDMKSLKFVPAGSVVLPKRGAAISTNRKRRTAYPSLLDPNLIALTAREGLSPDFLYWWTETLDLASITDAATLPQLNKRDFAPLGIPLPPLHEQLVISSTLDRADGKIVAEEGRRDALDTVFRSLLQELMTGKRRLQLDIAGEQDSV